MGDGASSVNEGVDLGLEGFRFRDGTPKDFIDKVNNLLFSFSLVVC